MKLSRHVAILAALFYTQSTTFAFTKSGTVYTTDGSQSDVQAAINHASTGDTIAIPAGTFTWGTDGKSVSIHKAVTLTGAGQGATTINVASSAPTWGNGTIFLSATGAVVSSIKVVQPGSGPTTAFSGVSAGGWRITEVDYVSKPNVGYFLYASTHGLIDNCTILGGAGNDELIFVRGPANSWQTPSSLGTSDAVYIEDCTFSGPGYVCDANSNARVVVRFCTITGDMKIDGHGMASNTPPRGVRHMEIYNNTWRPVKTLLTAIEVRGGSGMIFNNHTTWGALFLHEYGCTAKWANFSSQYQTPIDYPIIDQIGVGADPRTGGSEPVYLWNNINTGQGSGPARDWGITWKSVPTEALARYRAQTSNTTATFTMRDIVASDRDYFKHTHGAVFDGSSGVGLGTRGQMNAIQATKVNVGYWVTDEGEWNSEQAGSDGRLYVWNGSSWVLKYTPYSYPHPTRLVAVGNQGEPRAPSSLSVGSP